MQSTQEAELRSERIARIPETKKDLAKYRDHLKDIIESPAFRGSHRSAQFLRFICEQAMSGNVDSLKERAIGVELFGRSPSYDTGEDAIVRVTASDVRKRLSNFYLRSDGPLSELRIGLPVGSYVPEFARDLPSSLLSGHDSPPPGPPIAEIPSGVAADSRSAAAAALPPFWIQHNPWFWVSVGLAVLLIAFVAHFGWHAQPSTAVPHAAVLPWSVIFAEKREPIFVTSDPNIAEIQGLTNQPVSVSDYSNQRYIPHPAALSQMMLHICYDILRGDKAANVDTSIVAGVAELASESAARIQVRPARDLHLSDLDTDGSLIFLGSPRTDPWISLFDDQVDFRFLYDESSKQEIIENTHPRPGEPKEYVPTAKGFATGQSFAAISFIRNPNHAGNILILAGADAEGTRAAGEFVTNPASLSSTLQRCGIRPSLSGSQAVQHFQVLLRVHTMAGSPTAFDEAACHALP